MSSFPGMGAMSQACLPNIHTCKAINATLSGASEVPGGSELKPQVRQYREGLLA